jgi:hypothetical protein
MKKIIFMVLGVVLGGAAVYFFLTHKGGGSGGASVANIVSMSKNGASENEMLDTIKNSSASSRLCADDIIQLQEAHVADSVKIALIQKNGVASAK